MVWGLLGKEQETWEIRCAGADLTGLPELLNGFSEVLSVRELPRGYEISIQKETSGLVNRKLQEKGIDVTALIPMEASLEDTFIALTEAKEEAE